ncbi:unnamed protein product [Urochloa decumbens]|uniref:Neprosin PEP catalytic domain-containing protein n=1 Tax=Urochloa decumbens TaxID=240449 RepID=A0ABC9DVB8_9POAL
MVEPSASLGCLLKAAFAVVLLVAAAVRASPLVYKTIQSDDGDVIDCVDVYQQPALKLASPAGKRGIQAALERSAGASVLKPHQHQTWRKHESCPAGTVPIRRESSRANPEVAELVRRSSPFGRPGSADRFNQFGRHAAGNLFNQSDMDAPPGGQVEVAASYATNGPYLGARADVPYWKVDVHPNEFSMNYILVGHTLDTNYRPMPGAKPPTDLTNQIAVGLVAWPSLFGDSLSRLFVYYTTGGFHLVDTTPFALGAAWSNFDSQVGGDRNAVTFRIHRDPAGENWWVSVMDKDIGYYPETKFNTRFPEAVYVEMGGRVLDSRPGGNHTTTPMGSGVFSCAGTRFAATIAEYFGIASDGTIFLDQADRTITTTPSCYGARSIGFSTKRSGYYVSYGGPGGIYCDQPDQ